MAGEKVLICGAGVAGSILAFWLARSNYQVVMIERAKHGWKAGQGLEIEEPALKVVKAMGIMEQLRAVKTGELGFELVDENSRSRALLEVGRFSPTGALEMMRGDMVEVMFKAADEHPNVTSYFRTTIHSLKQVGDKVVVDLEDRATKTTRTEDFDFVIGADGVKSRTRELAMGSPEKLNCYRPVGISAAYFSVPKEDQDWPYSRLCNFPGRRIIWKRPIGEHAKDVSCYFMLGRTVPILQQANASGDRKKQKDAWADIYGDLGWEGPRIVKQMLQSDNFYSDELVQVKLDTWSHKRVVLTGDAAWAPTPITGQGNQLAIIGAWVLAQEMTRNRGPEAFKIYEERLRPYVTQSQHLPLGGLVPKLVYPDTAAGIWVLRTVFAILAWAVKVFAKKDSKGSGYRESENGDFDLEMDSDTLDAIKEIQ